MNEQIYADTVSTANLDEVNKCNLSLIIQIIFEQVKNLQLPNLRNLTWFFFPTRFAGLLTSSKVNEEVK